MYRPLEIGQLVSCRGARIVSKSPFLNTLFVHDKPGSYVHAIFIWCYYNYHPYTRVSIWFWHRYEVIAKAKKIITDIVTDMSWYLKTPSQYPYADRDSSITSSLAMG